MIKFGIYSRGEGRCLGSCNEKWKKQRYAFVFMSLEHIHLGTSCRGVMGAKCSVSYDHVHSATPNRISTFSHYARGPYSIQKITWRDATRPVPSSLRKAVIVTVMLAEGHQPGSCNYLDATRRGKGNGMPQLACGQWRFPICAMAVLHAVRTKRCPDF